MPSGHLAISTTLTDMTRAGFEVQLYALLRALYTGEESREDMTHYLSRLIAEAAEQGYQRGYAVGLSGARKNGATRVTPIQHS